MAAAAPDWLPPAQLAKLESLDASETARLASLLALYTRATRAARFETTKRSDRASNARVLQRLHLYPRLQQARCCARELLGLASDR
jgi:hypothetical protein